MSINEIICINSPSRGLVTMFGFVELQIPADLSSSPKRFALYNLYQVASFTIRALLYSESTLY